MRAAGRAGVLSHVLENRRSVAAAENILCNCPVRMEKLSAWQEGDQDNIAGVAGTHATNRRPCSPRGYIPMQLAAAEFYSRPPALIMALQPDDRSAS